MTSQSYTLTKKFGNRSCGSIIIAGQRQERVIERDDKFNNMDFVMCYFYVRKYH